MSKQPNGHGIVLEIDGFRGAGKTSIVNIVEQVLHRNTVASACTVIRVTPWFLADAPSVVDQILSQILHWIDNSFRRAEYLKIAASYFTLLSEVLRPLEVQPKLAIAKKTVEAATQTISYFAHSSFKDLESKHHELAKILKSKHGSRLVVLLDELDDLPVSTVGVIFQAVGAISLLPSLSFLVSHDRASTQKQLDRFGFTQSTSFLEKLVSVSVKLRTPSEERIRSILIDYLRKLFGSDFVGERRARWELLCKRTVNTALPA